MRTCTLRKPNAETRAMCEAVRKVWWSGGVVEIPRDFELIAELCVPHGRAKRSLQRAAIQHHAVHRENGLLRLFAGYVSDVARVCSRGARAGRSCGAWRQRYLEDLAVLAKIPEGFASRPPVACPHTLRSSTAPGSIEHPGPWAGLLAMGQPLRQAFLLMPAQKLLLSQAG